MITEKSLVLYKNRPARVTAIDDKISIALCDGESLRVREKDLELLHAGPAPEAAELDKLKAEELTGDIEGARELLSGSEFSLAELAELAFGAADATGVFKAWLLAKDGLLFSGYVPGATGKLACKSDEEVATERSKREGKGREAAEREHFLERLKSGQVNLAEDAKRMQDIEALALGKTDKSRTMKDIGRSETPEEAHRLLLSTGYWKPDFNPHPSRFSQTLHSAKAPVAPPRAEERLDLTHLKSWAIDNAWSSDPDDAIGIDGDWIWVHVADPAASVLPGTEAEVEARDRGETLYLPEGTWRMIAEEALPMFALGLSPTSPALSFKIRLGEGDSIEEVEIHRTTVAVSRLTYEQADALAGGTDLKPLFDIAARLEQKRVAAGAIGINLPETHIHVDGSTIAIEAIPESRAANMVREYMVLAGEAAARWAIRTRVPFPFVTQEIGDLPAEPLPGLAGSYQLRRCMRPRRLQAQPGPHAGLGLGVYTQVTSPLRRYTDLLAHEQIRAVLAGTTPLSVDEVLERVSAGEAAARQAVLAERTSRQHWTILYLEKNRDREWPATVVEKKGGRVTAIIESLAWEVQVAFKGEVELNGSITVKLSAIKLCELSASFTAVE